MAVTILLQAGGDGIVLTDQFLGAIAAVLLTVYLAGNIAALAWLFRSHTELGAKLEQRLTLLERTHGRFFEIVEANAIKSLLTVRHDSDRPD